MFSWAINVRIQDYELGVKDGLFLWMDDLGRGTGPTSGSL